jgi:cobalt-zinc-cadmium efflux system membrane fusion protein
MNNACHQARKIRAARYQALLATTLLVAFCSLAVAQDAPSRQIPLSKAQIERAGIQTMPAIAASQAASAVPVNADAGEDGQHLSGTVVAPASSVTVVSAAVGGVVQQLLVSTLQKVEPDTPVATLFSQPLMEAQREYLHLAIQARLAREKLARDESLLNEGIISRARMQETRGAAMQAGLALDERYQALRAAGMSERAIRKIAGSNNLSPQLTVVAGARGTLTDLDIHAGQRIDAGMPIARISTGAGLWIELQASRQQAAQLRIGDLLQVRDCGTAKVTAISPQMNAANQSTVVRAQLLADAGCLRPNQYVEASYGSAGIAPGSVGVPAAAIVRQGTTSYLFVRNAQGFEAIRVEVLAGSGGRVWVTGQEGHLAAGSPVAVRGIVALKGSWLGLGADNPAPAAPDAKAGGAK